jgi:hypothetical protein
MFEKIIAQFRGSGSKKDPMKANAEKMFGAEFKDTSMDPLASLSAPQNEKMRMFKKGGSVTKKASKVSDGTTKSAAIDFHIPDKKPKMKLANNHTKVAYKTGGSVQGLLTSPPSGVQGKEIAKVKYGLEPEKKAGKVLKLAAGGVAKIRHGQSTSKGMQKKPSKACK